MGYRVVKFEVDEKHKLYPYFEDCTQKAKNLYNVTNFHIRQVMTGIQKEPSKRQENEANILDNIEHSLPLMNAVRAKNKAKNKVQNLFTMPTEKKWFLSYNFLDCLLKVTNNTDYYALPAQVNQQVMKRCVKNWKGYFNALKQYKKTPAAFTGQPKIPKYKKSSMDNVIFTAIVCNLKFKDDKCYIKFPKTEEQLCIGKYLKPDVKLQQVEVAPYYGKFLVSVIIKDKDIQPKECRPKRVFAIDPGVNNFATISNNIGTTPIIIKGGVIKSRNQYFNKIRAILLSDLQKGKDSSHSLKSSKRLNSLSRYRQNFLRDYFYKIAHSIVDEALNNKVDTIIMGSIEGWKQSVNTGKQNNQNFVNIPFDKFKKILEYLCLKNGIQYIQVNESYTSKASFLDFDEIPNYGDKNIPEFSGKRIKRGLYKSKAGQIINADINGASNILRKSVPSAFENINNFDYLLKVDIWNYQKYYK